MKIQNKNFLFFFSFISPFCSFLSSFTFSFFGGLAHKHTQLIIKKKINNRALKRDDFFLLYFFPLFLILFFFFFLTPWPKVLTGPRRLSHFLYLSTFPFDLFSSNEINPNHSVLGVGDRVAWGWLGYDEQGLRQRKEGACVNG